MADCRLLPTWPTALRPSARAAWLRG